MENSDQKDENARIRRLIELDKSALPADGGPRFNRLIFATSPYLLQHAENPVEWYQWGEEAFAKAREENRPIFLSIGYATCHWCHVMAHESFEDRDVAAVLNRHFVPIKVDREERPDIDGQFMAAAQMMTGSGGWPLNVILTPDGKPFFAATYMPKTPRMGMPAVADILERLAEIWRTEPDMVEKNCASVMEALAQLNMTSPGALPGREMRMETLRQLDSMYDPEWGGFGLAPKFPMPHYVSWLLRCWKETGEEQALSMVEHTLRQMRCGGICDQLGFGFHRYSVDRQWLAPHFEKMLYDQALLAIAYLEAFQATGNPFYKTAAEEIFAYVLREMTLPEGGFCSGQDADTEGEEGKYYLWTRAQVTEVLGEGPARIFCRLSDVTERGNFEGKNILRLLLPLETFAEREGIMPELLRADMERWREQLLQARERRIRPLRDEKVLTAWNGLMIAALAKGYAVTGDERYLAAAERGAAFVREKLTTPSGRLMRSFHLGRPAIPAFLEDYAFYLLAFTELYGATAARGHLADAQRFAREMLRLFPDEKSGALFDTGSDTGEPLIRTLTAYDGAVPSGNSVAAMGLIRLGKITGDSDFLRAGEGIVRAFMGKAEKQPAAFLYLFMAHDCLVIPEVELTLVGKPEDQETKAMLRAVGRRFLPGLVLRCFEDNESPRFKVMEGRTTAYLCAEGACRPPVAGVAGLEKLLEGI
ncbi:MAG: hypothetical protein FD174_4283 [Geobacteraceae bacterium]|nr:MAG: hypothetical protein FD174_4283 [Geobacteraceae bacterium]